MVPLWFRASPGRLTASLLLACGAVKPPSTQDRERLAAALKSREGFEAFVLSGAGMLDLDGGRRGELPAAAADAEASHKLPGTYVASGDGAEALEALRVELAARYDGDAGVGSREMQAKVEESMRRLGLTDLEMQRTHDAVVAQMNLRLEREHRAEALASFNVFSPSDGEVPSELVAASPQKKKRAQRKWGPR